MKFCDRKNLFIVIVYLSGMASVLLLLFIYSYFYIFSNNFDAENYNTSLIALGKKSIPSGDVPVSSVIIYNGKIVGEGYNDVVKNQNPSGHAEINAIADCFRKIGYSKFKTLNKDYLILFTTYEPCSMCKGAIQEYGIKKVVFSLAKRKADKISNLKNDLKYYYHLKQMKNKRLQYDLFKLHPTFDSIQFPY